MKRATAIRLSATAVAAGISIYSGGALTPYLVGVLGVEFSKELGSFTKDLAVHWLGGLFEDWSKNGDGELGVHHKVFDDVNLAIASCLELAATQSENAQRKSYLHDFTKAIRRGKLRLEIDGVETIQKDVNPLSILAGQESLTRSDWESVLRSFAPELEPSGFILLNLSDDQRAQALRFAAATLELYFPQQLKETYRKRGAENDPAWSKLMLHFLDDIREQAKKCGMEVYGLAERLDSMKREVALVAARIQDGLEDVLQFPADDSSFNWPFLYSKQETQLLGDAALQMINRDVEAFLADERQVCWWLWTGLEGAGKSRLALEACNKARSLGWKGGFVSRTKLRAFDDRWSKCIIEGSFLLVFDYVGLDPGHVRRALYELTVRAARSLRLEHPTEKWRVRVLLLERHVAPLRPTDNAMRLPQWWVELFGSGADRADSDAIMAVQYPTRAHSSFHLSGLNTENARALADEYLAQLDRSGRFASSSTQALSSEDRALIAEEAVKLVGSDTRPLHVMITARVLRDSKRNFEDFEAIVLEWLRHRVTLRRDELRSVYEPSVTEQLLNLLCVATVLGQLRLDKVPSHRLLPDPEVLKDKHFLRIFGQKAQSEFLSKIEPDLIGEWYVLYRAEVEKLKDGLPQVTPESLAEIVERCSGGKKGLDVFVRRTYRNFHDKVLSDGSKSALWRVLRGSLGRYATTFGEVFDSKQAQLLRGTTREAEERYSSLVVQSIEEAIQQKPNRVPVVMDLMAGGGARTKQLIEQFGSKIMLLAIDQDVSRLQVLQSADTDWLKILQLQINGQFSLSPLLANAFGRAKCDVVIAKKALHELPWNSQVGLIAEMGKCLSAAGVVVLYADGPKFMDSDAMEDWAARELWLREHLSIDGADDSEAVRRKLFPPYLRFDPRNPSSAATFINYWIKLKDWANYNAFEWANRFFSSANQIEAAFAGAGFKTDSENRSYYMEIQARNFVEEAINRFGYLYNDKSVQKEDLENVISQNNRYLLFWRFTEAHLWENESPTEFGKSVRTKMESSGLQDLIPEEFLADYGRLNLPDLGGPSFQIPIHVFRFRRSSV